MSTPSQANPDTDWLSGQVYSWGSDGQPRADWITLAEEIAAKRAELAAPEDECGPPVTVSEVRALVIASTLQECAARLRLTPERTANMQLAEFCDELAEELQKRTGLIS